MAIKLTKAEQADYDKCLGQCSDCLLKIDCTLHIKIKDLQTVNLTTLGFTWLCPDCQYLNRFLKLTIIVKCFNCNTEFQVKND